MGLRSGLTRALECPINCENSIYLYSANNRTISCLRAYLASGYMMCSKYMTTISCCPINVHPSDSLACFRLRNTACRSRSLLVHRALAPIHIPTTAPCQQSQLSYATSRIQQRTSSPRSSSPFHPRMLDLTAHDARKLARMTNHSEWKSTQR
jgi:hypothetical protein